MIQASHDFSEGPVQKSSYFFIENCFYNYGVGSSEEKLILEQLKVIEITLNEIKKELHKQVLDEQTLLELKKSGKNFIREKEGTLTSIDI